MKPSDKLTLTGYTVVEGVNCRVTLTVDAVAMIHELGHKAANNRNAVAKYLKGDIVATVSRKDAARVRSIKLAKRQALQRSFEKPTRTSHEDAQRNGFPDVYGT